MLRAIRNFYYWRRYGVCPLHLCLAERGGGYTPKWICPRCHEENHSKHEMRILSYENARCAVVDKLAREKR